MWLVLETTKVCLVRVLLDAPASKCDSGPPGKINFNTAHASQVHYLPLLHMTADSIECRLFLSVSQLNETCLDRMTLASVL